MDKANKTILVFGATGRMGVQLHGIYIVMDGV